MSEILLASENHFSNPSVPFLHVDHGSQWEIRSSSKADEIKVIINMKN